MHQLRPFSLGVFAIGLGLSCPLRADEPLVPEPARSSDSLVAAIAVATHFGYRGSVYGTQWEKVKGLLGDSGIRTIRDGFDPHIEDLWTAYGIQLITVTDEPTVPWDQEVAKWKANKHLLAAIEGPNEVNGGWNKGNRSYKGQKWPIGPRLYQDDLYQTVKGDPDLKDIPVIAFSLAYKGAGAQIAPDRSFDYANAHSYAGGAMPSTSLDFRDPFLELGQGATLPPLAVTESGYHTSTGGNQVVIAGKQAGISHAAQSKYIPRQVGEYFNGGCHWITFYEFATGRGEKNGLIETSEQAENSDPEKAFGLLTPIDANPKPAYYALKDLIANLSEAKWDPSSKTWIKPKPYVPQALTFALQGAPDTIHHALLQRSDGTFQLLLWNEVPSYDMTARKDITNADVPVHLVLQNEAASIKVMRLGQDAPAPQEFSSTKEADLQVPDEVIVVNIKLAAPLAAAQLAPPTGIQAKAGGSSVELSWPAATGADAYWVSLNQRNLGAAQKGSDGNFHLSVKGLLPLITYPFEIVAASFNGGVSAPAQFEATTTNDLPDLVVKSLKVVPDSPKVGDKVSFDAVVANTGTAPVEDGVVIGVKFGVDGKTVGWSAKLHGPLGPGQEADVKPDSFPSTWVVTPGNHQATAFVDDVGRIIESNKKNNITTIPVSGAAP